MEQQTPGGTMFLNQGYGFLLEGWGAPEEKDVCVFTFRVPGLYSEPKSPQCPSSSTSHLPLDFLCNLLNSQLVVLRQELQLLVNKPQPLLPLFTRFQAVDPERKSSGYPTKPRRWCRGCQEVCGPQLWSWHSVHTQEACSSLSRAGGRDSANNSLLSFPNSEDVVVTDRGVCFFRNFRTSSAIHIEKNSTSKQGKEKKKYNTTQKPGSNHQVWCTDQGRGMGVPAYTAGGTTGRARCFRKPWVKLGKVETYTSQDRTLHLQELMLVCSRCTPGDTKTGVHSSRVYNSKIMKSKDASTGNWELLYLNEKS